MELYYAADPEGKKELVKKFKKDYSNYRDDYVAINKDKNGEEILVFNTLVRVNDKMAWIYGIILYVRGIKWKKKC